MTDLLKEALDRIDGYTHPDGTNQRANRLHQANQPSFEAGAAAWKTYQDAISSADDYDVILQAALAVQDSQRLARAAAMIGDDLRAQVQAQRSNPRIYEPDETKPALDFLNDELSDLMRTVRAQEPALRGITNATDALRGGGNSQDAWQTVVEQVTRYEELRAAQRKITITISGSDQRETFVKLINRSGLLRAAFDHEYDFQQRRIMWSPRSAERGASEFVDWVKHPPRLEFERTGNAVFPDDPIAYLRWIADGNKAWVPDVAELVRVDELAETMLSHYPIRQRTAAHEAYYTARDLEPAAPLAVSIV
ncbi:hypothetical protein [Microbacterium sp. Leaf320]|uniref:hypothetical protein n=1 Tax=Microbacterium sp. Leaf320 TaxID=1736334 RepID=UPI0006FB1B88|nr:hypothetical protein [Microbacterium sp. Leaf320]KQQ66105.1 hypothetical protein ASF63_12345 [Microbacterium sp. Leaf320]